VALRLSFELGQRMGDCLNLQATHIRQINDPKTHTQFVAVKFVKGKTTRRMDPYTLHVPFGSITGQEVYQLAQAVISRQGKAQGEPSIGPLLFGPKKDAEAAIRRALLRVNKDLSILSVRRGGLQRMSLEGCSIACLMHHSRHADETMLNRYLGWGTFNLEAARERYGTTYADSK
jgi:hypothetical protein